MQLNRAFKYGDGLFETIRVREQKILHLETHFERLSRGLDFLQMQTTANALTLADFKEIITQEIDKQSDVNLRIRITFFRQSGGLYTPQKQAWDYVTETSSLTNANYTLNEKGLRVGCCTQVRLSMDSLAEYKTISALPYVIAGTEKKANQWDDCLILNAKDRLAESIAANIFMVKDSIIYTPALSEGCVRGVMRTVLIALAQDLNYTVKETKLYWEDLLEAEEIFLTNAIQGIQWVKILAGEEKKYTNAVAQQLILNLQLLEL